MRAGRPRRRVVLVGLVALALALPQHGHLVPPLHLRLRRGRAGAHPLRWDRPGRSRRAGRRRAAAAPARRRPAGRLAGRVGGPWRGVGPERRRRSGRLRHRPAGRAPPGRRRRPGRAGRDLAAAGPGAGALSAAVAIPARRPRFAVNLNAGPRMPFHVSFDPADEPAHWFVLDLAILRAHGRTLTGPPPAELVGPIPRRWQLEAVRDSLAWHQANEPALQQSVLNARRGWRYAEEDVWCSKEDAAAWAGPHRRPGHGLHRPGHPPRRPRPLPRPRPRPRLPGPGPGGGGEGAGLSRPPVVTVRGGAGRGP